MDQNTQPGMTNPQPMTPSEHSKTKPMILIATGVLVLIIALLYIFASKTSAPSLPNETLVEAQQEVRPVTNTSDEVSSIGEDLNSAVSGLDDQNF